MIGLADVKAAAGRLAGVAHRTPVLTSPRMVVPKKLSRVYDLTHPNGPG